MTLVAALLLAGAPRRQPFRRFATLGPGRMIALAPASKARALRHLALSVVEDRTRYHRLFARPAHRATSLNAAVEIPVAPPAEVATANGRL